MNSACNKRRIAALAIFCAIVSGLLGLTILSSPLASSRIGKALDVVPPPRPFPIPGVAPFESQPPPLPPASQPAAVEPAVTSGVWTSLTNPPPFFPQSAFLLTDGRVLVQDVLLSTRGWWTLTPDHTGSYLHGTWSQLASPPDCPNC